MIEFRLVSRFGNQMVGGMWRGTWRPLMVVARHRLQLTFERLSIGMMCRTTGIVLAAAVLASASTVLAPAALPGRPQTTVSEPIKQITNEDRAKQYAWLSRAQRADYVALSEFVLVPEGFTRIEAPEGSYADWLRHMPIAPVGSAVKAANGKELLAADDSRLAAAIALQPKSGRLLAGANMLIRLRAEYEWESESFSSLAFHLTSGHSVGWSAWAAGVHPVVEGRTVAFKQTNLKDASRSNFCAYLETLFQYTSPQSLLDDTRPNKDGTLAAGDLFLRTERRAEPLVVLDVATNDAGEVRVLLGRCGLPAQTFHVIRGEDGSAWFRFTQVGGISFDGQTYEMKHLRHWMR